jgi:hypothetical protein
MTDYKNLIGAELEKGVQLRDSVPDKVGMFNIKTANRTIMEAAQRPDPESLWKSLLV